MVHELIGKSSVEPGWRSRSGFFVLDEPGKHPQGIEYGRPSETLFIGNARLIGLGGKLGMQRSVSNRDVTEARPEKLQQ
jgi:hypothetical protein